MLSNDDIIMNCRRYVLCVVDATFIVLMALSGNMVQILAEIYTFSINEKQKQNKNILIIAI